MRTTLFCILNCATLLSGCAAGAVAQLPPGLTRDPSAASLVYEDVDRFATVYHQLGGLPDTSATLDSAYLQYATEGLRVYAALYSVTGEAMTRALRGHPQRYRIAARVGPDSIRAIEPEVRAAMARLQQMYPAAVFPSVYFLVGPQRAGGAVQREGVLIAVETYATPAGQNGAGFTQLPHLVAHELVHFQQAAWNLDLYQTSNSLLARAIKEGVADFLAELVSGQHTNPSAHDYGIRNERRLWERFKSEMHGTATGDWFFAAPADPDMPRNLGYFIGYRIARSRFQQVKDPAAGVAALIRIADYQKFLADSGYESGLSR